MWGIPSHNNSVAKASFKRNQLSTKNLTCDHRKHKRTTNYNEEIILLVSLYTSVGDKAIQLECNYTFKLDVKNFLLTQNALASLPINN